MEILGYLGAICVGLIMGLLGGGGAILSVPIFVYLFGVNVEMATAYSLFVVGSTAAIGMIKKLQKNLVNLKIGLIFAAPSLLAVYWTRRYLVPSIPDPIFQINDFVLSKSTGILLLFSCLMLFAAISMIRGKKGLQPTELDSSLGPKKIFIIAIQAITVGILAGLVGAGGGFLILPALVMLIGLPIKVAIGTTLLIITINSLIGFMGDLQLGNEIDWPFLIVFTLLAIVGIFIGHHFSNKVSSSQLKKLFGYFLVILAAIMIYKELF